MRITALVVEAVGRFRGRTVVEGFGPGINLLAAGNEAGKSTLFRAIRTVLFCRYDSKGQEIKDLACDDSELPLTVALSFTQQGHNYCITKQFLRSAGASLVQDGREIARNRAADERVWTLLGLDPGSGRTLDDGAFGVLWVGQGASFVTPEPSGSATSALNSAIEAEVGALVGGERARLLLDEIAQDLRRNVTESGRPKTDGPLDRAHKAVARLRQEESLAQQKIAALDQHFVQLDGLRGRQRQLMDLVTSAQLARELAEAERMLRAAQTSAREIARLEAEEGRARAAREATAQRLARLHEIIDRIDHNRSAEAALVPGVDAARSREQAARVVLQRVDQDLVGVERAWQTLAAQQRKVDDLAHAAARETLKIDLSARISALEEVSTGLRQIDAELARLIVTPEALHKSEELERRLTTLDAQLNATAPNLTITVLPGAAGRVRLGSDPITTTHAGAVLTPTTIVVDEIATITITPSAGAERSSRDAAEAGLSRQLAALGVAGMAEARAALERRRDLEARRHALLARLESIIGNRDPVLGSAELKRQLAEAEVAVASALAASGRDALPSTAELEKITAECAEQRADLERRRGALDAARRERQAAMEAAVVHRSAVESELIALRKMLDQDLALCSDAQRAERQREIAAALAAADSEHQAAIALLAARRAQSPDLHEIERLELRCERLKQAQDNRRNELMTLEREIGQLTGQIETAGGDGVGEHLATLQGELGLAERDLARIEGQVTCLQLLRDTIKVSLDEGRERYYEPVRRHLKPFLHDLFPGAELAFGEGYRVEALRRDASRVEGFKRLSDGTQEQIAVLVRLAMGAMLAERGRSVPVILDDALVYSDDDRIQRMFDALNRAARHQQVIVLTCRTRAFGILGGQALSIKAA